MRRICMIAFACVTAFASPIHAAQMESSMPVIDPIQYSAMRWRHVDLPRESRLIHLYGPESTSSIEVTPDSSARIQDPVRRSLRFEGGPRGVYLSFDDGKHWQSLQLNMPSANVRYLFVQQNALFAATDSHSVWVLDELSALRQVGSDSADAPSYLFKTSSAVLVNNPASGAAPTGAVFYYELKSAPAREITLEVHDSKGKSVRRFTSLAGKIDPATDNAAKSSNSECAILSKNVGLNRFVWDLRFADGVFVEPGLYEAVLIANDSLMKQPFSISVDSRTPGSQEAEGKRIDSGIAASATAIDQMTNLKDAIADRWHTLHSEKSPGKEAAAQRLAHGQESAAALQDLDSKVAKILNGDDATPGLLTIHRKLSQAEIVSQAGMIPDPVEPSCTALDQNLAAWRALDAHAVPATTNLIAKSSLAALPTATVMSILAMPQESSAAGSGCAP